MRRLHGPCTASCGTTAPGRPRHAIMTSEPTVRKTFGMAAAALLFQAACGSGGGIDGAANDRSPTDARDDVDTGADVDAPVVDAPVVDAPEDRADVSTGDASDARSDTSGDTASGCRISDGVWSSIPVSQEADGYYNAWAIGPGTFLRSEE